MSILTKRNRDIYENNKNMTTTSDKKRKIFKKKNFDETGEFIDGYYVNNKDFETFNVDINHFDIKLSHHYE